MRVLLILIMLVMGFSPAYGAGWVDDWLTSHSSVAPTSLKGQKRGYFTLGSFSGRRAMSTDRLFSVSPPKLKFGCGGIDAFLGGFSFLNTEYLVQKFQNILSAAPAAAFEIALNNLCEVCKTTIDALEGIADKLNSIQMDDCKLSRSLAVEIMSPLAPEKLASEKAEADKTFQLLSSSFDLGHAVTNTWESNGDKPVSGNNVTNNATNNCDSDVKNLFKSGSVLANYFPSINSTYSTHTSYIDTMRGFIGDVIIKTTSGGGLVPTSVPPCGENDPTRVQDFLEGNVYKKDSTGNCSTLSDSNKNIYEYVHSNILSIFNKIKNKQPLTSNERDFIASVPAPLLTSLKAAVETGADSAAIVQLSDVTAREYAFMIISDLYNTISSTIYKAEEIYSKANYDRKNCRTEFIGPIVQELRVLAKRARDFANAVRQDNARVASTYNAVLNMAERYEKQNEIFLKLVRENITQGVSKL
ncbi:MAG: hypothetical protein D6726_05070 [Nitrospirae bacterium]|nr:MAG: hypothetical protein D6726_05070 [Nitrospirota bacterium]